MTLPTGLVSYLVRRVKALVDILYEPYMTERRSHPRVLDSELVMVCWEENSKKFNQLGNIRDLSLGGIGVLVGHSLPVGTSVTISYGKRRIVWNRQT